MYDYRIYNGKKPTVICGNYANTYNKVSVTQVKRESDHHITATVIELVRDTLKAIADYAKTDKVGFIKSVQETLASKQINVI